jgi:vacuolar-type H+-ATPase subunit H
MTPFSRCAADDRAAHTPVTTGDPMNNHQDRILKGNTGAGRFTATTHTPGTVQLGQPTEHELERRAVNTIYTAGRGFGRNRHGNIDRINEAYDAAGAYIDALGEPGNPAEAEARDLFRELRESFEADAGSLDDKELRDRKFAAARQASWVIEYRQSSYNNTTKENDD